MLSDEKIADRIVLKGILLSLENISIMSAMNYLILGVYLIASSMPNFERNLEP